MFDSLTYLTAEDKHLMMEAGKVRLGERNDVILTEGSRQHDIFLILDGRARVEKSRVGNGVVLASLEPGAIFGEMAFIDNSAASATVVADSKIRILVIEEESMRSLLETVPGFSTRFFQSVAVEMSHRLREISEAAPAFAVEDVPQVVRFHTTRTGQAGAIPPALIDAIEVFKDKMLAVELKIKEDETSTEDLQDSVSTACNEIKKTMTRHADGDFQLEKAVGGFVFREAFPFFMSSRLIDRCYIKPRGYAGDFETIEQIYANREQGDGRTGALVDRWALNMTAAQSVRDRRQTMAGYLAEDYGTWRGDGPMLVTSLACGSAREVFDFFEQSDRPEAAVSCVDIDTEALSFASDLAVERGLVDRIQFIQGNLVNMAYGKAKTKLPPQQVMYSMGLINYLPNKIVLQLLDWIYDHLLPGGRVILGCFGPKNPDKVFMDSIIEWVLIHRSPFDLLGLFERSKFQGLHVSIDHGPTGVQLFASCRKE